MDDGVDAGVLSDSVTGHTVVETMYVSVVTCGPAGQLVTVGAHEVTVYSVVVQMVDVVYWVLEDDSGHGVVVVVASVDETVVPLGEEETDVVVVT